MLHYGLSDLLHGSEHNVVGDHVHQEPILGENVLATCHQVREKENEVIEKVMQLLAAAVAE